MRKYKLCLGTNDQFGLPNSEQIALFKETGFDAFFMGYCGKDSVSEARTAADKNKMIFQSVHAPFGRMNEMWADGKSAADELIQCVHACADNGVPIMVAHTYIGFGKSDGPNEKGFENFGRVIDEASRLGSIGKHRRRRIPRCPYGLFRRQSDSQVLLGLRPRAML